MGAAVVTIEKKGHKLRSLTLEPGESFLGRSAGCVIRLDDRAVSRQHAVIKSGPGGLRIEKKSPLAPLVVNGAECDMATLKEGDEVMVGPFLLRIEIPAENQRAKVDVRSVQESPSGAETQGGDGGAPESHARPLGADSGPDALTPFDSTAVLEPVESSGASSTSEASASADLALSAAPLSEMGASGDSQGLMAQGVDGAPSVNTTPDDAANIPSGFGDLRSLVEEGAKTRLLTPGAMVKLKLKFTPGAASIEMK